VRTVRRPRGARLAGLLWAAAAALAQAQEADPKPPQPESKSKWEGAVGLIVRHGPAFGGSSDITTALVPAGFARYGRFTLSGAGGFTTRKADDVERGLAADLGRIRKVRFALTLRIDPGRKESDSPQLEGMGNVPVTVRARLLARWAPVPEWRLTLGLASDVLNRQGGYLVDANLERRWKLEGAQRVTVHFGLSGAGDRYMQTWYGVDEQQSLRSGYPQYDAREGLRGMDLGISWRTEFAGRWAAFTSLNRSRSLGAAADSPLTRQVHSTSLSTGLAWRF
jgi:outer membrane scaffolding protein for murein synthesis (MipA/OmpV family)